MAEYFHNVVTLSRERGLRGLAQRLFRLPMCPVRLASFYAPLPNIALEAAEREADRLRAKGVFHSVYVESVRMRMRDTGFASVDFDAPDPYPEVTVKISLPEGMDQKSAAAAIKRAIEEGLARAPEPGARLNTRGTALNPTAHFYRGASKVAEHGGQEPAGDHDRLVPGTLRTF